MKSIIKAFIDWFYPSLSRFERGQIWRLKRDSYTAGPGAGDVIMILSVSTNRIIHYQPLNFHPLIKTGLPVVPFPTECCHVSEFQRDFRQISRDEAISLRFNILPLRS